MSVESKIEIIDNQILNCYECKVYKWEERSIWSGLPSRWDKIITHLIGKKFTCPEIANNKITVKDYFLRDVRTMLNNKDYNFTEIHNIIITNDKTNI